MNPFETVPESWKMTLEDIKALRDEEEDEHDHGDGEEHSHDHGDGHKHGHEHGHEHPNFHEGSDFITIWPDGHEDYQEGDYKQSDYDKEYKQLDQLYPEEDFMWIDDQDNAPV